MARILVVDDEKSMREFLEIFLRKEGHEVVVESSMAGGVVRLKEQPFNLVLTDLKLGRDSGIDLLRKAKELAPETEVVMFTAFGSTEVAVQAMKLGAYDFLTKPIHNEELAALIEKALEKASLARENRQLRKKLGERDRFEALIGDSPAVREVMEIVEKVAPTKSTVLVTGETGTGKELVARAIHAKSGRAQAAFVPVNCGAIPEGLIESELFGHVKGSFTGAVASAEGLFRAAHGGTIFLDEVGELPLQVQVKLLRVIQERRVKKVGAAEDAEVDVRIVAATNRDLQDEVRRGRFREDLFYRLNVIQVRLPPLRERRQDVLPLAEHFVRRMAAEHGRPPPRFTQAAAARLEGYDFPGNVRELQNLMERAMALSSAEEIGPELLPAHGRQGAALHATVLPENGIDLQARLDAVEREYLEEALRRANGVKTSAAKLLGLSFRSFRYRLGKLGIGGEPEPEVDVEAEEDDEKRA